MDFSFHGSVADLVAVAAIMRGEVVDDATITKLQSLNQTLRTEVGALQGAVDTVPKA